MNKKLGSIFLALLVILILALMIVPMPPFFLDILLSLNITISATLLLTALYVSEPLKIASFPTMLLIATMFRLGLNVTSTRLILLNANAGQVIDSFGQFVVSGNFVVGAIVFFILVIIQFIVIAKGSERVAEVAARFTLDAMPGKQMAIDAELRSGHINYNDALTKRNKLQRESQLYGAMDGAMKFVKGDAIAGLIITFINIIGGLIIGVTQMGMSISESAKIYTVLTIGDGLVSAIPSLLISLSAGFIITRVASETENNAVGDDIIGQISSQPAAILWVGSLLIAMGIIPGMPTIPFMLVGIITFIIGIKLSKKHQKSSKPLPEFVSETESDSQSESTSSSSGIPMIKPIVVEISDSLESLNHSFDNSDYLKNIIFNEVRNGVFWKLGVPLHQIEVKINSHLPEGAYVIILNGYPEAKGKVIIDKKAVNIKQKTLDELNISYEKTVNYALNEDFLWISLEDEEKIAFENTIILSPEDFIAYHLEKVLFSNIHELLNMDIVNVIVKSLEKISPALVDACFPTPVSLPKLTEVCQKLVEENIPIKNMDKILDTLRRWIPKERDSVILSEYVRMDLKKYISAEYVTDGILPVWLVSGDVEEEVRMGIKRENDISYLALDPEVTEQIQSKILSVKEKLSNNKQKIILVCSMDIRRFLRQILAIVLPEIVVLSYQELDAKINIQPLGEF